MVQQFAARSKLFFAAREVVVHFEDFWANLSENFLWCQPTRTGYRGSFPPGGQVSELNDDQSLPPLLPGLGGSQRLARFDHACKSLQCSGVGQIQMFQYFGGTPLSRWVLAQLFWGQSGDCRGDLLLQSLEMRVHECHLPF